MRFYKVSDQETVAQKLAQAIAIHIKKGEKVFWLTGGGSAVAVAVQTSRLLNKIDGLERLAFTLTDERFGKTGHSDSNWQQLIDAGFSLPESKLIPVLNGNDIESTTKDFSQILEEQFKKADYVIGLFGIGTDGHTAGILPNSPATQAEGFATSYTTPEFKRITMTFQAIKQVDEVLLYATGEHKHKMLDRLEQEIRLNEQPAQILKQISQFSIYNDYKGESI
jgi:6-phosphogluconolactonase/glucosamine-6-phosphate isomerase/deaminase